MKKKSLAQHHISRVSERVSEQELNDQPETLSSYNYHAVRAIDIYAAAFAAAHLYFLPLYSPSDFSLSTLSKSVCIIAKRLVHH